MVWDNPSADITNISHVPAGCNVLYLDGHVDFFRLEREPEITPFPVSFPFGKMLDERPRAPIPDCDG